MSSLSVGQRRAAQRVPRRALRVVGGLLGGIILLEIAHHMVMPPARHQVLVLRVPLAAGTPITPTDVMTMTTASAWPGALSKVPTGEVANTALAAGTPVLAADFVPAADYTGLKPGELLWTIPVTPTTGGLVRPGERVEVWSTNGVPHLWAVGVRVVGIYSSSGVPVTTVSSGGLLGGGSGAVGMVGLAVPAADMATFLGINDPVLVQAGSSMSFTLITPAPMPVHTASSSPSSASSVTIPRGSTQTHLPVSAVTQTATTQHVATHTTTVGHAASLPRRGRRPS